MSFHTWSSEFGKCPVLQLEEADDWEEDVDSIMERFAQETALKPLYSICFA